jgi:hypothetical protein
MGARRRVGALVLAAIGLLSGGRTASSGSRGGRKRCPKRDTCPTRFCCSCLGSIANPACSLFRAASAAAAAAECDERCKALELLEGELTASVAGQNSPVCLPNFTCQLAACPI